MPKKKTSAAPPKATPCTTCGKPTGRRKALHGWVRYCSHCQQEVAA